MALSTDELVTLRDALVRARARGVRVTMYDGKRVEYGSDAEMAAAIGDLDRRIAAASGPRPGAVAFSTSKGL
jgi:hypothetical protein